MNDTPEVKRIRDALAAGPTPGPWTFDPGGFSNEDVIMAKSGFVFEGVVYNDNGQYIAACNPAAMDSVLAHIDAQTKRIAAFELLVKSIEGQRSMMRVEIEASKEARETLQSERDANALLTSQVEAQAAEIEKLRNDYNGACKLVADMHAAAMGEITGPGGRAACAGRWAVIG